MAALVESSHVEAVLREHLTTLGYHVTAKRAFGETGCDIIATRDGESIYIEAISFKSSGPQRAKDFYEAFFRATSRLGNGATRTVIALPVRFETGLPARAAKIGPAWTRIGSAFPELEIWLVDTLKRTYRESRWESWARTSREHIASGIAGHKRLG